MKDKASSRITQFSSWCRDEGKDDTKKEQLEGQLDNPEGVRTVPPREQCDLRWGKRSAAKSN